MANDAAAERKRRFDQLRLRTAATHDLPEDCEWVAFSAMRQHVVESLFGEFVETGHMRDTTAFSRMTSEIIADTPKPAPKPISVQLNIVGKDGEAIPLDELRRKHGDPAQSDIALNSSTEPTDESSEGGGNNTPSADSASGGASASTTPMVDARPSLREMTQRDRATVAAEIRHGANGPYYPNWDARCGGLLDDPNKPKRAFPPAPLSEADRLRAVGITPRTNIAQGHEG
jgi:hypothetical protein